MASKPTLSREYIYVPFSEMNMPVSTLSENSLAFMPAGEEPVDADWVEAIPVASGHALYSASIGEALALLIGPVRGDAGITSEDPGEGDFQVWVDARVTGSDERIVRVAGLLEITRDRGVMAVIAEGEWIRVVVPEAAFPMAMSIDGGERKPAFIDRVESDDDGVVVVAAMRCPALRRGPHSVTAYTASGSYTATFEVD